MADRFVPDDDEGAADWSFEVAHCYCGCDAFDDGEELGEDAGTPNTGG